MNASILPRVPTVAALAAVWVLLHGEATAGNLVAGVLVGTLVVAALPLARPARTHRLHPLALLRLLGHVLGSLVTSSARVLVTVLRPTPARLRSGIVRVDLPGTTPLAITLVANAISVTPGTLTLEATEAGVLHVHVLGLGDVDAFRGDVLDLHARVVAALAPRPRPGSVP